MAENYWDEIHKNYFTSDWAGKPSAFSQFVIKFFPKKGRLLDIGTGQGGDAKFFQSMGYKVVATDISLLALKVAKKNVKDVEFLNLDTAEGLPFPDESFDIVYSQ